MHSGSRTSLTVEIQTARSFLLAAINADRARHHLAALLLDPAESKCSLAHTRHMIRLGGLAHDQFPADVCVPHGFSGENIGVDWAMPTSAVVAIDRAMYGEGPCPDRGCPGTEFFQHGHYLNIISPIVTSVGIGIAYANGFTWLTEDFIAPPTQARHMQ